MMSRELGWLLLALAFFILLLAMQPAPGRDFGQWSQTNPGLRDWIKGLRDKEGQSCCSDADGQEVEGWSFQRPADLPTNIHPQHLGYWVKVQGQWLPVPPKALLEIPNRLGFARVWIVFEGGNPIVRCFIAGAGG